MVKVIFVSKVRTIGYETSKPLSTTATLNNTWTHDGWQLNTENGH